MRTKKAILNYITEIIPQIIIAFIGIFKVKLFLQILGENTSGLYQVYTQFMSYMTIVDGGLTTALLCALYKPLADKDKEKTNQILAAAFRVYSLIGIFIMLLGVIISFFIPNFIKGNVFPLEYIVITFIIYTISGIIGYFFVPYKTLFEADQKKYVVNIIFQTSLIVTGLTEIIMLLNHCSFTLILVMHAVITLITNVILFIYGRKSYSYVDLWHKKKDFTFSKEIKHLMFHKIGGVIANNIDIVIISKVLGLTIVPIYSTYNYIVANLMNVVNKFSSALLALVGNFLTTKKNEAKNLFLELNTMVFFIGTCLTIPLLFAINGFIDIFYEGLIKTSSILALLFSGLLFYTVIRIPFVMFGSAAGLFKETKICTLLESTINLTLSLILVRIIGLPGVLLATLIAYVISDYCIRPNIIFKHIFNTNAIKYYLNNFKYLAILIIDGLIGFLIFNSLTFNNLFYWFITFAIYFVINTGVILFIYYLMKDVKFINRLKYIVLKNKS